MDGQKAKKSWVRPFFKIIWMLVVSYLLLSLVLAVPFSNLLFKPPALPGGVPSLVMPAADRVRIAWMETYNVQVDVLTIASPAGPNPIKLSAWWVYRDSARGKPTVVFLAGNGGLDPGAFDDEIRLCCNMGFNCLLLDQRGYGASSGELLSHGWYEREDFAAAVDTIVGRYGMDAHRVSIWGFSMGASNTVIIAAARPEIKSVLLYAPWSDPLPMAVHYVWRSYSVPKLLLYFPVWAAIQIGTWQNGGGVFDPAEEAGKVRCPALVVYGDADDIVPPELALKLYRSLAGPKERVVIPGAHHNDLFEVMGHERYLEQLRNFFSPLLGRRAR